MSNHDEIITPFHYSEWGINKGASEPWHVSVNGISLEAYTEFRPGFSTEPKTIDEIDAAAIKLAQAVGFSTDVSVISEEEKLFYTTKFLTPMRVDEMPTAIGYVFSDWGINSGIAAANIEVSDLYGVPLLETKYHIADELISRFATFPPWLVVNSICDRRWAKMQAKKDFFDPSIYKGHIKGEGRAKRMSDVHRNAMKMLGYSTEAPKYVVDLTKLAVQ